MLLVFYPLSMKNRPVVLSLRKAISPGSSQELLVLGTVLQMHASKPNMLGLSSMAGNLYVK